MKVICIPQTSNMGPTTIMTTTLTGILWRRVSVCATLTCYGLTKYTAYLSSPISEGFDAHGLQSTQISDVIDNYDLEDECHWPEPTVNDQTNDPFKYSSAGDSLNPTLLPTSMRISHPNYGQDYRSTPTTLDSHPSTVTQAYNPNAQERISPSLGSKPRSIHGIRLRPISDLRLSFEVLLGRIQLTRFLQRMYTEEFSSSVYLMQFNQPVLSMLVIFFTWSSVQP
jgi:hypothetical protein